VGYTAVKVAHSCGECDPDVVLEDSPTMSATCHSLPNWHLHHLCLLACDSETAADITFYIPPL